MEQVFAIVVPLLLAFGLCTGLIVLLIRPAQAWGWVDRPTTRKHHRIPVPLVGGVAMCAAYCLAVATLSVKPEMYLALLTGSVLLTAVGVYDDFHALRPVVRFVFQIVAVLLMAFVGNIVLVSLGDLLGAGPVILAGGFGFFFTLFCVVGVINAVNMSDGLDGLAGGMALIVAGWLIVLAQMAPVANPGDYDALLALIMVIAGFLCFNLRHPWRSRASVFMGDAGSTLLGFNLACFLVHFSQGAHAVMVPMTAVWLLALPLMDTIAVMIRRLRSGHSPFAADRQHLHYLLLGRGVPDGQVTVLLLIGSALTGAAGAVSYWLGVPDFLQFYAFLMVFGLYYQVTTRLWREQRHAVIAMGAGTAERRADPHLREAETLAVVPPDPLRSQK